MTDSHLKSVAKGLSWRCVATFDTILLSFLVTHHLQLALKIGAVEVFTKTFLFYIHERIWGRIHLWRSSTTYHEGRKRSLIKGISWRFFGTADTTIIASVLTGQLHLGASIGALEFFTKIFLYFVHERVWVYISTRRHAPTHFRAEPMQVPENAE